MTNSSVLVVAAHPDDEVLGCGGAIAKHVDSGDAVSVMFLTGGTGARGDSVNAEVNRKEAAIGALERLGVSKYFFNDLPDNELDKVSLLTIVREIERVIDVVNAQEVYTHYFGDLNIDHQLACRATITATRPQPHETVKKILLYEVLSSTEWNFHTKNTFSPNYFVDVTDYMKHKLDAIQYYESEMRKPPHSRSLDNLKNLMSVRGNTVGLNYCEAFEVARIIT